MDNEKKQQVAKILYTRNHSSEHEIVEMMGISMQELARWVQAGNWEAQRRALLNTKEEQLRNAYDQISNLNAAIRQGAGYPNEKEAMTQKRLASTIQHLETDASVSNTITIAKEFCDFVYPTDVEFGKSVLMAFDKFIKQKISKT